MFLISVHTLCFHCEQFLESSALVDHFLFNVDCVRDFRFSHSHCTVLFYGAIVVHKSMCANYLFVFYRFRVYYSVLGTIHKELLYS